MKRKFKKIPELHTQVRSNQFSTNKSPSTGNGTKEIIGIFVTQTTQLVKGNSVQKNTSLIPIFVKGPCGPPTPLMRALEFHKLIRESGFNMAANIVIHVRSRPVDKFKPLNHLLW